MSSEENLSNNLVVNFLLMKCKMCYLSKNIKEFSYSSQTVYAVSVDVVTKHCLIVKNHGKKF